MNRKFLRNYRKNSPFGLVRFMAFESAYRRSANRKRIRKKWGTRFGVIVWRDFYSEHYSYHHSRKAEPTSVWDPQGVPEHMRDRIPIN